MLLSDHYPETDPVAKLLADASSSESPHFLRSTGANAPESQIPYSALVRLPSTELLPGLAGKLVVVADHFEGTSFAPPYLNGVDMYTFITDAEILAFFEGLSMAHRSFQQRCLAPAP